MKRERREILQMVPLAMGAGAFFGIGEAAAVGQATNSVSQKPSSQSPSSQAPSSQNSPGHDGSVAIAQERVTGIGGFFFRAHDPRALGRWYQEQLGILVIPTSYDQKAWEQEPGPTAIAPFPETTKYFGDMSKQWMLNFRVRDLDKIAALLRAAGIEVKIDPQTYPNGRFASLNDPEGNPIQLWQPV